MKKKFIIVLLLTTTCLTGCVEYRSTMNIKNDKSMIYSIEYALDSSIFGDEEMMDAESKSRLEIEGFTIKPYEHDNMKGYRISKSIKNIDSYSSEDDVTYNLSGIMDEEEQNSKIFKVEKGFFKNIYYTNFSFDASDSGLSNNEESTSSDSGVYFANDEEKESFNEMYDEMMSKVDLSFKVKLPTKVISHNAKKVTNDDKELSWDLSATSQEDINFSFYLYNLDNIALCIAGIIIVILVIAIILINIKKAKTLKSNSNWQMTNDLLKLDNNI